MQSWNVVFLLDQNPPIKIVMLKRAETKKFAPGMYTGVGGKVEPDETLLKSSYRELKEETGITDIRLKQFAKVTIDKKEALVYFWGIYKPNKLPACNEGTLEWVSTDDIFTKPIIPTTLEMIKKWQLQSFSTTPFEINVKTISEKNGVKQVEVVTI